ncbi:hypothetical protein PENSPDRAFT_646318 [Peniophora sp. CONT]|nr:hypothetical protein PENSPDRAFT_646318 [Peniophora sp. CONT]
MPINLKSKSKAGYIHRSASVSTPRPAGSDSSPLVAVAHAVSIAEGIEPRSTTTAARTVKRRSPRRSESAFHTGACSFQPRFRALLFGLTYEGPEAMAEGLHPLTACHNDARNVANLLQETYGWEDITIMTDEVKNRGTALWPSKENMERQMQELVRDARAGDMFFVYYAGHSGQVVATVDKNETDGKDEHMIPADGGIILDDDLRKMLVANLCKGTRLTAVFDSCHSGTLLDLGLYRTLSRMSDITQECDKAPDVEVVVRADSMPNPKRATIEAAKCVTRFPWIAVRAVIRFSAAAMRNGQSKAHGLHISIPAITIDPAPEVSSPVDLTLNDNFAGSDVSSVLTEPPTDPTGSTVPAQSQSPPPIAERTRTSRAPTCKHCRHLASQPAIVNSISACMDGQRAGEDSREKKGVMTPSLIELLKEDPHLSSREIQTRLQPKMFDTCCKFVLDRMRSLKNSATNSATKKKKPWQKKIKKYVNKTISWQVLQFGSEHDRHMDEPFLLMVPWKNTLKK